MYQRTNIKVSSNPLTILTFVVVSFSIYAHFTTTSIPLINYLLIGFILVHALSRGTLKRCLHEKYFLYLILQVIYIFLIGMLQGNIQGSTMMRSSVFQLLICLAFFVYAQTSEKAISNIFVLIALSVLVLCCMILLDDTLLMTIREANEQGAYYTYDENNRNTIGTILAMGSLYMLHLGLNKCKVFFLFMFLPIILGLITGSRKVVITVVAGFLLYLLFYSLFCIKKEQRKGYKVILIIIVSIVALIYACYNNAILYNIIGFRLEGLIGAFGEGGMQEASAIIRAKMTKKAVEMFLEKPIWGWGLDGFAAYSGFNAYSHNNYTEILVSFGLVGFLFLYLFKVALLTKQIQLLRKYIWKDSQETAISVLLLVLMVVSLILDWAMVSLTDVVSNLPFALAAANQYICKARLKKVDDRI